MLRVADVTGESTPGGVVEEGAPLIGGRRDFSSLTKSSILIRRSVESVSPWAGTLTKTAGLAWAIRGAPGRRGGDDRHTPTRGGMARRPLRMSQAVALPTEIFM